MARAGCLLDRMGSRLPVSVGTHESDAWDPQDSTRTAQRHGCLIRSLAVRSSSASNLHVPRPNTTCVQGVAGARRWTNPRRIQALCRIRSPLQSALSLSRPPARAELLALDTDCLDKMIAPEDRAHLTRRLKVPTALYCCAVPPLQCRMRR